MVASIVAVTRVIVDRRRAALASLIAWCAAKAGKLIQKTQSGRAALFAAAAAFPDKENLDSEGGGLVSLPITVLCLHCQHNSAALERPTSDASKRNEPMPRHPDPELEERILHAAQKLWKRGGEKSLTMRAVARAAGTDTPAVYRRFKDRRDLVRALMRRTQENLRERLQAGESIEEMAEAYVEYALHHP